MFFRGLLALGMILGATGAPLWAQSPTPTPTPPPPPAWWSSGQPLIRSGDADHDNYRPANLGQLKNFADKARLHLNDRLATVGGAGPAIEDMVTGWPSADPANYAPLNLGQLKAVADKYYARLDAVGFDYKSQLTAAGYPVSRWTAVTGTSHERPWDEVAAPATNYAPANLGQLKVLFSFDLSGFTPGGTDPDLDTDNDGVPDAVEIAQGTDPHNYFSQTPGIIITPRIFVYGGNNVYAESQSFSTRPVIYKVVNAVTNGPLPSAPVFLSVQGAGTINTVASGLGSTSLQATADSNGLVKVFFRAP